MAEERKYSLDEFKKFQEVFGLQNPTGEYLQRNVPSPAITEEKAQEVEGKYKQAVGDMTLKAVPLKEEEKQQKQQQDTTPVQVPYRPGAQPAEDPTAGVLTPEDKEHFKGQADEFDKTIKSQKRVLSPEQYNEWWANIPAGKYPSIEAAEEAEGVTRAEGGVEQQPAVAQAQAGQASMGTGLPSQRDVDDLTQANIDLQEGIAGVYDEKASLTERYREKITDILDKREKEGREQLVKINASVEAFKSFKLDPNRYFSNLSVPQKILGAIALFLGGMTRSDNAIKYIQKQLDLDIKAQESNRNALKEDINIQKGVYDMIMDQGEDKANALATVRLLQLDELENQVLSLKANFEGDPAVANPKAQEVLLQIAKSKVDIQTELLKHKVKKGATKDVIDLNNAYKEGLIKDEKLRRQQAETSVVIGKTVTRDPKTGKDTTQNITFRTKNKETGAKANKEVQDYTFYKDIMNNMEAMAQALRADPSLAARLDVATLLKRFGLTGKMKRRIEITGGGNVSNYEQILLNIFQEFGFIETAETSLGQAFKWMTSPIKRYTTPETARQFGNIIRTSSKGIDRSFKAKLKTFADSVDFGKIDALDTKSLLEAYGYSSKGYKIIRTKDGDVKILERK